MREYSEITIDEMIAIASKTLYGVERHIRNEKIVSEFGASPDILIQLWKLLCPRLTPRSEPHHMLWWLYLCKHYPTKGVLEKALRVSAPTFRKAVAPVKRGFFTIRNKVVRTLHPSRPD